MEAKVLLTQRRVELNQPQVGVQKQEGGGKILLASPEGDGGKKGG